MNQSRDNISSMLGKIVDIKVDRPLGSVHPKHPNIIYPVNYGYIPGTQSGDGEEIDVYLLGVKEPVEAYTCKIIGIVYRENDVEDKLIAAPVEMQFHQAELAATVQFQEQYYKTKIDALYHKSCGVILYRRVADGVEYLLLWQTCGTWSVPKGHIEPGETETEAALREVWEEVGIRVEALDDFYGEVNYTLGNLIEKKVALFAAEIDMENTELEISPDEILEYRWVTAGEAKALLYPGYSAIFDQLEAQLKHEA